MPSAPVVLSICGSDSSGAAGLQADLPTLAEYSVRATSALTVVTAQTGAGFVALEPVGVGLVAAQIDAAIAAGPPAATKTGLLGRLELVDLVASRSPELGHLVVDPVLATGDGRVMVDGQVIHGYRSLAAASAAFTPNLREVELLLGLDGGLEPHDVVEHADALRALGCPFVVVTGGRHRSDTIIDVEITPAEVRLVRHRRVGPLPDTAPGAGAVRGTGDVFSAALAAGLAHGRAPTEAAIQARGAVCRRLDVLWKEGPTGPGRPGLPHHRSAEAPLGS